MTVAEQAPRRELDALGIGAMTTYVLVGALLVFGFAWAIYPAVRTQNAAPCRPMRPEARDGAAPEFAVQDLDGNPVSLADFRGKFVVLNFWATWCEPCITEWPEVQRLAERLAGRDDVVVVAMSIDTDPAEIRPFLARMSMTETDVVVLWDPNQEVHTQYGTELIPDTYFIDAQGRLVDVFVNVRKWGSPDAYHCVESRAG